MKNKKKGLIKYILENKEYLKNNNIIFSEDDIKFLSFGWKNIGNICIIKIPSHFLNKKITIAKTLILLNPSINIILENKGIYGKLRIPKYEIIYPLKYINKKKLEIIHKENNCYFKFDVLNIMFSKGNLYEKIRMTEIVKNGIVVDMFAGIGYFSIPIAVHSSPKKIYSIELNKLSYNYLCENIKLNKVENIIIPIFGDCREKTPFYIADYVIMGYIKDTLSYLKYGILSLKKTGGILFYHDISFIEDYPNKQIDILKKEAEIYNKNIIIKNYRIIKKYSPKMVHIVIDIYLKDKYI